MAGINKNGIDATTLCMHVLQSYPMSLDLCGVPWVAPNRRRSRADLALPQPGRHYAAPVMRIGLLMEGKT